MLSNPSMEQDSDSSFHLYNHNNSEKDALSEAIMTIPTTYAQHGNNTNFKFECSDNMNDGNHGDESRAMQVTSEMLSKAINVVEGDHNLYFDKVIKVPFFVVRLFSIVYLVWPPQFRKQILKIIRDLIFEFFRF